MQTKPSSHCSFEALPDLGNVTTYQQLKALALKAGRFSIFEATQNQRIARLFVKLDADPEVDVQPIGFPWSTVRKRDRATAAYYAEGLEFPEGTPERVEWLYRKSEVHKTRKK